jgi:hypothetical protein
VQLNVEFLDADETVHSGKITFTVFDMATNDMIIGLPDLLRTFGQLFINKIMKAIGFETGEEPQVNHLMATTEEFVKADIPYGTLISSPWSHIPDVEAPEDRDTPLPCSFTYALHFMEMSVAEAQEEFFTQVASSKHIAQAFREAKDIENLLKAKGIKVFVPQNWTGINGLEPLELVWKPTLPEKMKPAQRHVNPRLMEDAKLEFDRLKKYMYVDSNSDICSPLVKAPKATKPFIRFCGDYVKVNLHMEIGHFPIPDDRKSLEKISGFKLFADIDMVNSFHQIKLGDLTSHRLSIQTTWGQVRPLFMPEGIGPASGVLQRTVSSIFSDFSEWLIYIFDNLLICAYDYDDLYNKIDVFLDRCIERNVFLKFGKTYLGFDYANFFGYVVRHESYELSQERKDEIMQMPFPNSTKSMQSFLRTLLQIFHATLFDELCSAE